MITCYSLFKKLAEITFSVLENIFLTILFVICPLYQKVQVEKLLTKLLYCTVVFIITVPTVT